MGTESFGATAVWVVATVGVTAFVSRIGIAVVAGIGALVSRRVPQSRPVLGVGAGALLLVGRVGHQPELAWLALALFAVSVFTTPDGSAEVDAGTSPPAVEHETDDRVGAEHDDRDPAERPRPGEQRGPLEDRG